MVKAGDTTLPDTEIRWSFNWKFDRAAGGSREIVARIRSRDNATQPSGIACVARDRIVFSKTLNNTSERDGRTDGPQPRVNDSNRAN